MIKYRDFLGKDATTTEIDNFISLVRSGGAVDVYFVRQGIKRTGARIVTAEIDGKLVGVAALKIPLDQYRSGLEGAKKANHPLPKKAYPYELGYVSVSPDYGKRGIGKRLVEIVLERAEGRGVFATTSHPAMKGTVLPKFGFALAGTAWANNAHETLHLLIRSSEEHDGGATGTAQS